MTKMVGAAEFKAKCLRLIEEMLADGEPITVTRRGKPVAVVSAPASSSLSKPLPSAFGLLRSDRYWNDADPSEPAVDPADWETNNPADLYRRA